MPGRGVKIESFPLDVDTRATPTPRPVNCSRVFISLLPDGARGQVRMSLDGTDVGFVKEGRYYQVCDGSDVIRSITVTNPALSGDMEVVCANSDALPFDSGGVSANTGELRRLVEAWWYPHGPVKAGDPMDLNTAALPGGAVFWSQVNSGGLGGTPFISVRNIRCAVALPNAGGSSGFIGAVSWPWARKRIEVGGGGATLVSRVHPRVLSFNVEFLLRCEGNGNSHASNGTGLQFVQSDGTKKSLSGNVAGFGIVRDGVAGAGAWWQFVARSVDGALLSIARPVLQPVGATVTAWTKFRIEVADADPIAGRDGRINVYVNDQPSIAFGDADMGNFPPSSDGANRTGIDWQVIGESQQADALCWSRGHYWIDSLLAGDA